MSSDLEHRAVLELRADQSKIVGHAIVCDVRSKDLGGFVETVAPSAIERALTADVICFYNHDVGQVLGRTPQTLHLSRDKRGLAFELDVAPTQAGRDALALVARGDVRGASFGFKTVRDQWTREGETRIRTLLDIELYEISLTAAPMYAQTDVSVALRSQHAAIGSQLLATNARSIARLRRQLKAR